MQRQFFLILLLVSQFGYGITARSEDMKHNREQKLRTLSQMSAVDRDAVLMEIEREWTQTKETLITNLGAKDLETRCASCYLLGLYRYSESVDSLARIIVIEDNTSPKRGKESRWDRYPAVEALIRIGNPSIPAVIRNLESSDDPKIRDFSLKVVYYVEKDSEITQLRLRRALGAQREPQKRARLESALKAVTDPSFAK